MTPDSKPSKFKFDLKLSRRLVRSHVATRLKGGGTNEYTEDHVLLGSSVLNVAADLETYTRTSIIYSTSDEESERLPINKNVNLLVG